MAFLRGIRQMIREGVRQMASASTASAAAAAAAAATTSGATDSAAAMEASTASNEEQQQHRQQQHLIQQQQQLGVMMGLQTTLKLPGLTPVLPGVGGSMIALGGGGGGVKLKSAIGEKI